jgi:hypothetical protein
MTHYMTPDGYRFYLLPDGTLADNPNPAQVDMSYDNLADFLRITQAEAIADNVGEYFHAMLFPESDACDISRFADFPMDSECGAVCKDIVDRTISLLAICDAHMDVRRPIITAVFTAIHIVCFA